MTEWPTLAAAGAARAGDRESMTTMYKNYWLNNRIARVVIFCVLAVSSVACQAAPQVIRIALRDGVQADASQITDYPTALNAILRVLAVKFALPIPPFHTMEIYPTREEFEGALINELKFKPEIARTTSEFAKAAVGNSKVLVNEAVMAKSEWPERILTLAHELVHTMQADLADFHSLVRNQWLVEGFAEWVAFQVTGTLGLEDVAKARARMIGDVREVRRSGPLPALRQMDSLEQWILTRNERGFNATYPYVFLITDYLVERHSYPKAVDYFRRFGASEDHVANFKAAFGEDLDNFQAVLDRHFAKLLE